MKPTLITIMLAFIVSVSMAQSTIPVGGKVWSRICKSSYVGKQLTNGMEYRYDMAFYVCSREMVYVNYYRGKWYSNYPYKVVVSNNKYRVYKSSHLIYTQIINKKITLITKFI